jgi:hypothetical protein
MCTKETLETDRMQAIHCNTQATHMMLLLLGQLLLLLLRACARSEAVLQQYCSSTRARSHVRGRMNKQQDPHAIIN